MVRAAVGFQEYRKIRDRAFKLGRASVDEIATVEAYIRQSRVCPACGADPCAEEAFNQGVQECRQCGAEFCWSCGDGDYCGACAQHEG